MTLFAYVGGSDDGQYIRLNALGLTSNSDGSVGFGGIIFDDPTGVLTIQGWQEVVVRETDCTSAPILFKGWIGDRTYSRLGAESTYRNEAARFIDTNIVDQNAALTIGLITGSDGKRPAETHAQRLAWILGSSYVNGLVSDLGLVNDTPPANFDEADFRGQHPIDVITSIASVLTDAAAFVYISQPSGAYGLFFDHATATTATSTISISNVLTDITYDTDGLITGNVFPPTVEAELHRDPSAVVSLVQFDYTGGRVVQTDTDTYDDFFSAAATGGSDLGNRGVEVSSDRVGRSTTAVNHALFWLDKNSTENDTITVTIQVPSTKVGLVDVGQRIGVRFSHLPGFELHQFMRITTRTIQQAAGNNLFYDVTLELNNYGVIGTGGGGTPAPFPHPPATAGDVVQSIAGIPATDGGGQYLTLPAQPSVGNTLVVFLTGGAPTPGLLSGWTDSPEGVIGTTGLYQVTSRIAWRLVTSSDTTQIHVNNSNCVWANIWEITGTIDDYLSDSEMHSTGTKPSTVTSGTITTTGAALILSGVNMSQHDWSGTGDQGIGDDADWTHSGKHEITNPDYTSGNDMGRFSGNVSQATYRVVTGAGTYSPTYALTGGANNFGGWGGLMIAIEGTGSTNPPAPGQPVPLEEPTLDTDGLATTYRTAHPFADGSLRVYVDQVDQTGALTSYDGACGDFVLSFVPRSWELVQVTYQGR